MSIRMFSTTNEISETVGASTTETICRISGNATTKAQLVAWHVSFNGVTNTYEPILIELRRQSGGSSSISVTPKRLDLDDTVAQVQFLRSFTAEPTQGERLEQHLVHPQGGLLVREYPPGRGPWLDKSANTVLAVVATIPAGVTGISARAFMAWTE